jgi:hypothetical protein
MSAAPDSSQQHPTAACFIFPPKESHTQRPYGETIRDQLGGLGGKVKHSNTYPSLALSTEREGEGGREREREGLRRRERERQKSGKP